MVSFFQHRGCHCTLLLAAGVGMFLVNLGSPSLWDRDEGCNAACALEMLKSGDYIVPHFNGQLRTDKPALLYWLQVAAYKLLGVDEFSARLPSALASWLALLICYELGRSLFGKTTGLLAGLMICSTPLLFGAARFANPDALLHFFIVSTMFFFWQSQRRQDGGAWWFVAMGAAAGLGVLAKGPVGVVLPGTAIFIYCAWSRNWRAVFRPALWPAVLACLAVALPWYVRVAVETKSEFLKGFLLNHNVGRFLAPMESHHGSVLYYPATLLIGTAPWSVLWWLLIWQIYQSLRRPTGSENHPGRGTIRAFQFLASWLVVVLVFFSLAATKLPNYVLPALVPCALLLAHALMRWCRGEIQPPVWLVSVSLLSLGSIGLIVGLGTTIASGAWPNVDLMNGRTYPGLERLAVLGLVPILGAAAGLWLTRQGRRTEVVWVLTITSLGFAIPMAIWGNVLMDSFKAPRALIEQSQAQRTDVPIDIYCWNAGHLPSLNFYARRDLTHCETQEELLTHLRNPTLAYLILPAQEWEFLKQRVKVPCKQLGQHYDMLHNETLIVIGNH